MFALMNTCIWVLDQRGCFLESIPVDGELSFSEDNPLKVQIRQVIENTQKNILSNHIKTCLKTNRQVEIEQKCQIGEKQVKFNASIYPVDQEKVILVPRDIQVINSNNNNKSQESYLLDISETDERLQRLLEAIPGIVSWISTDLHYLGVNRHLAEKYNMTPEEFIGKNIGFLDGNYSEFTKIIRNFFASNTTVTVHEIGQHLIVAQI